MYSLKAEVVVLPVRSVSSSFSGEPYIINLKAREVTKLVDHNSPQFGRHPSHGAPQQVTMMELRISDSKHKVFVTKLITYFYRFSYLTNEPFRK